MCNCPNCGFDLSTPALARVTVHRKPWGSAPVPRLSGLFSDLSELIAAGYAERDTSGWFVPTDKFPV